MGPHARVPKYFGSFLLLNTASRTHEGRLSLAHSGLCFEGPDLDAVGAAAGAWLGWLVNLPRVIAGKAANMDASAWAAWVQAVGSILAIGAGFLTMFLQSRHADNVQAAERVRRAEVVAYRLSGWIGEIGGRIERALRTCQERQSKASQGPPRVKSEIIPELRLGMASRIDGLLPELHYLSTGSRDIAQLEYLARGHDAWLDGLLAQATSRGSCRQG